MSVLMSQSVSEQQSVNRENESSTKEGFLSNSAYKAHSQAEKVLGEDVAQTLISLRAQPVLVCLVGKHLKDILKTIIEHSSEPSSSLKSRLEKDFSNRISASIIDQFFEYCKNNYKSCFECCLTQNILSKEDVDGLRGYFKEVEKGSSANRVVSKQKNNASSSSVAYSKGNKLEPFEDEDHADLIRFALQNKEITDVEVLAEGYLAEYIKTKQAFIAHQLKQVNQSSISHLKSKGLITDTEQTQFLEISANYEVRPKRPKVRNKRLSAHKTSEAKGLNRLGALSMFFEKMEAHLSLDISELEAQLSKECSEGITSGNVHELIERCKKMKRRILLG